MAAPATTPRQPQPASPRQRVTRRNFIVWYLGGLLAATAAAVVAPLLVYVYPPESANKKKVLTIGLQKAIDQIIPDTAVGFDAPPETGFVMVDGGGDNGPGKVGFRGYLVNYQGALIVLSATCSHLGCQINFEQATHDFHCPCHGSHFAIDGQVTHGPAVAPLSHYAWRLTGKPTEIQVVGVAMPGVG